MDPLTEAKRSNGYRRLELVACALTVALLLLELRIGGYESGYVEAVTEREKNEDR